MKKLYHICMTAHSEVLLRNLDDVRIMTNLAALSAFRNDADILTDSQMSTHSHETAFCECPDRFATAQEISITKAFNSRYGRKGKLFDGKPYILELQGPRHTQMALNYTLRQGFHHGQSETAFDYPWSTCNSVFAKERGLPYEIPKFCGRSEMREFFPKNADFPDAWQADSNGILLRRTFEELTILENWYGTPRNYLYSMMRRTTEEWLAEQVKDNTAESLITLDILEKGYSSDEIAEMLKNEGSSKFIQRGMSDMDLCQLIDSQLLGRFRVSSVYALSQDQKEIIAAELRNDFGIRSDKQIARCLAMDYHR